MVQAVSSYGGQVVILRFKRFGSTVPLLLPLILCLLLFLPPPAPPSTMLEANFFSQGTSSTEGIHNFIIYALFPTLPLPISGQTTKAGISPLPPPAPPASSSVLVALICPESPAITGRGSLSRSVLLLRELSTLWHRLGVLKSKHTHIIR